jgi:triosephosphate isomerase
MTKLIVGNWKMNGLKADARSRIGDIVGPVSADVGVKYSLVLCPPATLLDYSRQALDDLYVCGEATISLGAQDCHAEANGAFTGDIAPRMLTDCGCRYVILGHSERRQGHGETDAQVAAKAKAAHQAGLITIVCVGETEAERAASRHFDVVARQVKAALPDCATVENTVIAYEPVWAIGTGKTATAEDVRAMHAHLRELAGGGMKLLYGGSVKPANAAEILSTENVDGVLVGGASLVAADFVAIARASA